MTISRYHSFGMAARTSGAAQNTSEFVFQRSSLRWRPQTVYRPGPSARIGRPSLKMTTRSFNPTDTDLNMEECLRRYRRHADDLDVRS